MELLIIVVLLAILAETTYIAAQSIKNVSYRKYYKPIFVDTSVLIDGRILPVAKSGFITGTLLIPRSVVGELQLLADQADHDKRTRARHGLDLISELMKVPQANVKVFADKSPAREGVDNRLLTLARKYRGAICTIDFNLNKVAQVERIPVLNVNDLAMNLRMAYLPGEKVLLEITQKGNDSHQGVGHLVDGTMVVVEQGSSRIGKTVEVEFIRSLQTAAGKMMFARVVGGLKEQASRPTGRTPKQPNPESDKTGRSNQPKKRAPQQRTSKSRRSGEDSLIELANKIGE